jgi:error-prone DNA polymerase
VSFAYLVYASSWLKLHHPAAFYAGLLNAQPMGFWSPHSLAQDARRHGVVVRTPDLAASAAGAGLERDPASHGEFAVRLGLADVRGIGSDLATVIVDERRIHGDYASIEDLVRRVPSLTRAHLEALSTAGAFTECLGVQRREALWMAGAAAESRPDRLAGVLTAVDVPRLPGMEPIDEAVADLWATGIAPTGHPTQFLRARLDELGVVTADRLATVDAERVWVAGVVTHRQRPSTAQGTTFMNLEDETGLVNVVVSVGCWKRFRAVARGASSLLVRGRLQRAEGVINIVADHIAPLRGSGEENSPYGSKSLARNWR